MKVDQVSFIIGVVILCTPIQAADDDNTGSHDGKKEWSYIPGQNCPNHWPMMFPNCAGERQSPINIEKASAKFEPYLNDVELVTIEDNDEITMGNNGHSVYLTFDATIHINGGGLGDIYQVFGPHFHWGNNTMEGSEHTVDGKAYPLEMHIVTYDAEKYQDIQQAIKSNDGKALAVFGVLFQVGAKNNTKLQPIIENLKTIHPADGVETVFSGLKLQDLLPKQTSDYYRYMGSLTTPECHEVVIWTLFDEKVSISEYQLAEFRNVLDGKGNKLGNNYRPVQALNGRQVTKSFQTPGYVVDNPDDNPEEYNAGSALNYNCYFTLMLCVLALFKIIQ